VPERPATPPLILSAVLDVPVQQRLDALRRAHFPPERNHLDAHVTLFHHLPGAEEDAVAEAVTSVAREHPAPPVEVTGVRLLGRGVAVTLVSPELAAVRADLARAWAPWLTPQDRGKRDLHVTVQNKVSPEAARALHAKLTAGFVPERTRAVALALWRYRGGPWEAVARFAFAEEGAGEGTAMADSGPTVLDVPERERFEIHLDGQLVGFAA
jgi:2'-5' RNA ligase